MDRWKRIGALEESLYNVEIAKIKNRGSTERKMRLSYLLAKLYLDMDDITAIFYFYKAKDLLEDAGKRVLMGFRNFYRYREKLEGVEYYVEAMVVE